MLGGVLFVVGYSILVIEVMWVWYMGLVLIIFGVGCFKFNIFIMVGGLYGQGDKCCDMGFYIFYMGINLGVVVFVLIVGYVGEKIGWYYGFGLVGIGMVLGQLVYVYG